MRLAKQWAERVANQIGKLQDLKLYTSAVPSANDHTRPSLGAFGFAGRDDTLRVTTIQAPQLQVSHDLNTAILLEQNGYRIAQIGDGQAEIDMWEVDKINANFGSDFFNRTYASPDLTKLYGGSTSPNTLRELDYDPVSGTVADTGRVLTVSNYQYGTGQPVGVKNLANLEYDGSAIWGQVLAGSSAGQQIIARIPLSTPWDLSSAGTVELFATDQSFDSITTLAFFVGGKMVSITNPQSDVISAEFYKLENDVFIKTDATRVATLVGDAEFSDYSGAIMNDKLILRYPTQNFVDIIANEIALEPTITPTPVVDFKNAIDTNNNGFTLQAVPGGSKLVYNGGGLVADATMDAALTWLRMTVESKKGEQLDIQGTITPIGGGGDLEFEETQIAQGGTVELNGLEIKLERAYIE